MSLLGAVGIGSSLLQLGSSIFGGNKASKAMKQANNLVQQQKDKNQAWYDRRYNEDYSQTAEAQNMLNYAREQADKVYKRAEGAAAVAGATEESVARAKEAGNEMISNTARNIAAQGTARKDAIEQQYMNADNQFTQQQISALHGKAQGISQAAGQASNLFGSIGQTALNKIFNKK